MGPQEKALRAGVEVLVATPGRLLDHMRQNQARFDQMHTLVLDEADRMLDMGFLPDLKRIIARLPARKQTLLFSATMPPVIAKLAAEILRDPLTIQIGRRSAPAVGITQAAYPVAEHLKTALLRHLLRHTEMPSVLVFTRTKHVGPAAGARHRRRRLHGDGAAQQPDAAAAQPGDGGLPPRRLPGAGGDEHRRPRPRRGPHHARHQLRRAERAGRLRPPHRPHRPGPRRRATPSCWSRPPRRSRWRAIERQIGQRLPRVTLPDFDYSQSVPQSRDKSGQRGSQRPRTQGKGHAKGNDSGRPPRSRRRR